MASPPAHAPSKSVMEVAELVEYTKKELAADAEREAHGLLVTPGPNGTGEPLSSQTGVTLDLSHKNIKALPVEVIFLIRDRVERLALSHNLCIQLPSQIVQLERLRYLNIRWNGLRQFPDNVLQLSQLEILDLSKNKIAHIPEGIKSMTSLKFLAIAKNRVTRLPFALGEMMSLSKLKFDENPIEFPPPDALKLNRKFPVEIDKEREICNQVKKFLRAAALREQMRTTPDEEQSESQLETPRPSRRLAPIGGHQRFPVKPSVSGIDAFLDPKVASQDPPIIPPKSHARMKSSTSPFSARLALPPAPLTSVLSGDTQRTLSITSAGTANKRHGLVPRKGQKNLPSVSSSASLSSISASTDRSSQATIKATQHIRGPSTSGTFLFPGPTGDSSSEALSPVNQTAGRHHIAGHLSTLREKSINRIAKDPMVTAASRLTLILHSLSEPLSEVIHTLHGTAANRSGLDRASFNARAYVQELERCLHRLEEGLDETLDKLRATMRSLSAFATSALRAYAYLASILRRVSSELVHGSDPCIFRMLMVQMFMTMVEARNIVLHLGFRTIYTAAASMMRTPETPRDARVPTSRTVTPTQAKAAPHSRLKRAPTIVQNPANPSRPGMAPPPVSIESSRSNTMTSLSVATPRSAEPTFLPSLPASAISSRVNTTRPVVQQVVQDSDPEQFESIWLKLDVATTVAEPCLRNCSAEISIRLENANNMMLNALATSWSLALTQCNIALATTDTLQKKLKDIKMKDPKIRTQKEFWTMCDNFVHSWTDLVLTIKNIGDGRFDDSKHDVSNLKRIMRDVQRLVKESSKVISCSPLYIAAIRGRLPENTPPSHQPLHSNGIGLAPPLPTAINTHSANSYSQPSYSSYSISIPATPLSAALGPAVQATLPQGFDIPADYFAAPKTATLMRADMETPSQQQLRR